MPKWILSKQMMTVSLMILLLVETWLDIYIIFTWEK